MTSTPLWVPLVVAGIGVAGTLAAGIATGVVTQRRADRREREAWNREREREHERWGREDQARTFEHRREAFVDFYLALRAVGKTASDHIEGYSGSDQLADDWFADADKKLGRVQFYAGNGPIASAALEALVAAAAWGANAEYGEPRDPGSLARQKKYIDAEREMLMLMRQGLGLMSSPPDNSNEAPASSPPEDK